MKMPIRLLALAQSGGINEMRGRAATGHGLAVRVRVRVVAALAVDFTRGIRGGVSADGTAVQIKIAAVGDGPTSRGASQPRRRRLRLGRLHAAHVTVEDVVKVMRHAGRGRSGCLREAAVDTAD